MTNNRFNNYDKRDPPRMARTPNKVRCPVCGAWMQWVDMGLLFAKVYVLECEGCHLTTGHGKKRDVLRRFDPHLLGAAREMREMLVLILPGLQPDIFERVSELLARTE